MLFRSPPALLLVLGILVLIARPDEGDPEVALLPVHGHFMLPGRDGRGRVLLGCEWAERGAMRQSLGNRKGGRERVAAIACGGGSVEIIEALIKGRAHQYDKKHGTCLLHSFKSPLKTFKLNILHIYAKWSVKNKGLSRDTRGFPMQYRTRGGQGHVSSLFKQHSSSNHHIFRNCSISTKKMNSSHKPSTRNSKSK